MHQPFQLIVESSPNESCALIVLQRPFPVLQNGHSLPPVKTGSIDGLALSSVWDLVLEVLRSNHHKPAAIQRDKNACLDLDEVSGVRLSLLFKTLAPLSNLDLIRELQQAIWAMSDELCYYWFSQCSGPNADRGIHALRILHGAETIP